MCIRDRRICVLPGIKSELYYVRDGIINNYALSFNMPINANIDEIYFTWQSLRDNPQVRDAPFVMNKVFQSGCSRVCYCECMIVAV